MVERIVEQQQPLCAALLELRKGDLMPSDREFTIMEAYLSVMKPLVEITEALGAKKWVTISTIRPLLYKLQNTPPLAPTSSDSNLKKILRKSMLTNLNQRYLESVLNILNKATLLDLRFKSLSFLPKEEKQQVITEIEIEVSEILSEIQSITVDDNTAQEPLRKKQKGEYKLLELIDDVINPVEECLSTATNVERAKSEVLKYIDDEPAKENPLL